MYKKIMVAIADSDTSRYAFTEALRMARPHGARLCITHVADETLMGMYPCTFGIPLNAPLVRQYR